MHLRIQILKVKYLRGWERQATVILIASALLLTLHRFYSSRTFFKRHFAEYFGNGSSAEIYPYYYWFLTTALTLLLIPALVAKFGTREPFSNYGFQFGDRKLGWRVAVAISMLMIPIVILGVIVYPSFIEKYPICKAASSSWQVFLPYQAAYGVYMFSWEFFFRGFMLFGLERKFGNYSILIQTIPFAIMHYSKPLPEALGSIIAGILLGVLALETRSFIYGAAIHWLVAMSMDTVAIGLPRFFLR